MAGPVSGEQSSNIGAIPGADNQQQTAAAGIQITALLGQRAALDSQIAGALPGALTPVKSSGVATPTLPGSFNFGVGQPQMPAPQGSRDARNQGIAKTVAGVGNIVGAFLKHKNDEKTRVLATDIHRVLEAQDAISQAGQLLQSDPNNKDAKAIVDKNKQIINDTIGADPKKLKQFEKAFDIDFTKPEENNTPENKALHAASKTYADQLAAKTPDKLAPNQQAINKVQILQHQVATLDSQIKALMSGYVQEQRDIAAGQRVQEQQAGAADRAILHEDNANARAGLQAQIKQQQMQVLQSIAKLRSNTQYSVQARRDSAAMDRTLKLIEGRQTAAEKLRAKGNTTAAGKIDEQNAALYQKEVDKMPVRINNMIQARDNDVKAGASAEEVNKWNEAINQTKSQQLMYQKMLSQYAKENMNLPPEEKGGTNNNGPTAQSNVTTVGNTDDFNDQGGEEGDPTDPDSDYYK